MRTTTKLSLAMILIALIPLISINIYISGKFSRISEESLEFSVTKVSNAQAENIGVIVNSLQNQGKNIAVNENIITYAGINSMSKYDRPYHPEYDSLENAEIISMSLINAYQESNANVEVVAIMSLSGEISALSEGGADFSEIIYADREMITNSANGNGVTPFFNVKISGNNTPAFYVCRNIVSDKGDIEGILVQLCTATQIQKSVNSTKVYSSSSALLLDSDENLLSLMNGRISNFDEDKTYEDYSDFISKAITSDGTAADFQYINKNKADMYAYVTDIPSTSWKLLSFVNKAEMSENSKASLSGLRTVSLWLFFFDGAFIVFFVILFSKPIMNIVSVLTKKAKGDQSARFEVTSYDEFGQIGKAFNTMFDDVFESEQRYRTIVEMTNNIVFEINLIKKTVYVSNNFNQKFSFRPKSDDLMDSFFYKGRVHKDDRDRYFADLNKLFGPSLNYLQGEYRFQNVYGDFAWVMIRASKFFGKDDVATKIIGVIVDIDREKKDEMCLFQRANFDALTQLYNRETFLKALAQQFENITSRKNKGFILFIDLDDFKHFNDDYGHSCGDEVLKYTADSIKEIISEKGFAGRFGGDEFVICINSQSSSETDPAVFAGELISALGRGFTSESTNMHLAINCSIGIAYLNENGKNCEEVLNAADEAMYGIKKHGKSNFGFASSRKEGAVAPVPKPIDSEGKSIKE